MSTITMARETHLQNMWKDTCENFGFREGIDSYFKLIVNSYSDSNRGYHGLAHLTECVSNASWFRHEFDYPNEAIMALFFHDAVYDTHDSDYNNVMRSASACETVMNGMYVRSGKLPNYDVIERTKSYIRATGHSEPPNNHDESLIMDIDLAVVASHPAEEIERGIRKEYKWVPLKEYSRARKDVLIKLYNRNPVFNTPLVENLLGNKMRHNLLEMIQLNGAVVAVGGTFDLFHAGHKKLIDVAFTLAGHDMKLSLIHI